MEASLVLVVLAERGGAEAALRHAAIAAAVLPGPFIRVLHVRVDPRSTITPEEIMTKRQEETLLRAGEAEGADLRKVYEAWAQQLPAGIIADWQDLPGTEAAQIKLHAKKAALLVIPAPTTATRGHALQACHTALFDVHRPLLAVPPDHHAGPVQRIVIGWKEGEVTRQAVKSALPWLAQAADVQIVRVGEPDNGELAAADQYMASLSIRATARAVAEAGLADGERLLAEARTTAADWLVMGAYRHNRLVEWVLGGMTRTVLHQARLPVFMQH